MVWIDEVLVGVHHLNITHDVLPAQVAIHRVVLLAEPAVILIFSQEIALMLLLVLLLILLISFRKLWYMALLKLCE